MKKSSLKKRLMFSYVLVSMLLLIVGGVGYYFETKILTNYEKIVSLNLPNAVLLGDMNQDVSVIMQAIQELAIDQSNPEEVKGLQEKITQKIENFETLKSQFEQTSLGVEGEGEVYAPVKDNWPKLKEFVLKQSEELAKNKPENREQFYKTFKTEIGPLYHDFSENLSFVLDFQKAASSENVEKATEASIHGKYFLIGTIIAGVLFALSFGLYFSKSLSNELLHLADELKNVVQHILSAGQRMSSSSRELLNSVQHEVEAIQETSSATEELRAMVKKNEENAFGSKSISEQSMQTSILGRDAVVELKSAIDEIDNSNKQILESVQKSNGNITMISNSIREIGEKTKVINEIVFQTKLLSFNASVEAARAGEQGKGFAVVAEEVGNLAQMSGNAAKEISDLLNESINKVEAIIAQSKKEVEQLVYESKSKLEKGYTASENCKQVLEEVVTNATKVNDLLSEISDASKEQSIGIEEIAKAITQIDSNTNTSSNTAKNTEVSSTSLMKDAEQLDFIAQKITETVVGT